MSQGVGMPEDATFSARLAELAASRKDRDAIRFVRGDGSIEVVSWRGLDAGATTWADRFAEAGLGVGDLVATLEPSTPAFFALSFGAWRAGVGILPLDPRSPDRERDAILNVAAAAATIRDGDIDLGTGSAAKRARGRRPLRSRETDPVPLPGKAMPSGGSTGRPKVIVDPAPWVAIPGDASGNVGRRIGFGPDQVQLVAGRLHHNAPFCWAHWGLFEGQTLVLMEHFQPEHAATLFETQRVEVAFLAPTMMWQMTRDSSIAQRDLSAVTSVWHTAGPCPAVLKRAWLELLGPERLYEIYGSTEAIGVTVISGSEWLMRPGSVGRPVDTELVILDDDAAPVPPGTVGEIYMRPSRRIFMPHTRQRTKSYQYLGGEPSRSHDGLESVGDLGHIDDAGYLYLADRRSDLIVSGGTNVYPSEVEAAILEHPGIRDAVVIGLEDPEWGRRVHAIVEAVDATQPPAVDELGRHVRERLSSAKHPRSWEFVDRLPRDPTYGKIRRSDLRASRSGPDER